MNAQSAWLLGPLRHESVPPDCIIAQITGPRAVFRDFAASKAIVETNSLFPTRKEDPILDALLGVPWKEMALPKDGVKIPAFQRGLDIPEYQDSFRKISLPNTAFYRGAMLNDQDPKFPGLVVKVPEIVLFGTPSREPMRFPKIEELLAKNQVVAFEVSELLAHVQTERVAEYQKGVVITAHQKNLFEVGALIVEHPGLDLSGAGVNVGWHYRVGDGGIWVHETNEKDCPCDNLSLHKNHFEALKMIERYLENPREFR